MSLHIFANIVTPFGTAANNRGENEGNYTTLQKIIWMGLPHTTISAESIRFALRRLLAEQESNGTNRTYNERTRRNEWQNDKFSSWSLAESGEYADNGVHHIDDDLLGFMSAEAAKGEAEDSSAPEAEDTEKKPKGRSKKPKGTAKVRRGVLELTRAVSLTAWPGDMVFNAASPRATPSASKSEGDDPVPYGAEVHATRYQYGLSLTPERLRDPARAAKALRALAALHTVAGNHSRFLFDFSPESLVFRITDDPAPRLLYCFDTSDDGRTIEAPLLQERISLGDIKPEELIIGGPFSGSSLARELKDQGATIPEPGGIRAAVEAAIERIEQRLSSGS